MADMSYIGGTPHRLKVVGLLLCLLLTGCRPSKAAKNPEAVKRQLDAAILPHSGPIQVFKYLDSQKIAHSPYHRDSTYGNIIEGVIEVKLTWAIVDPNYEVLFRFDDQDHLIGYDVEWLGYIGL
jgi:hypothetical protein